MGAVLPLRTRRTDRPLTRARDSIPRGCSITGPCSTTCRYAPSSYRRSASSIPSSIARTLRCRATLGYSSVEQFFDVDPELSARHPAAQLHLRLLRRLRLHRSRARRRQPRRLITLLQRFDAAFSAFLRAAAGLDATVIVTADHGFIDSPPGRLIELQRPPAPGSLAAAAVVRRAARGLLLRPARQDT